MNQHFVPRFVIEGFVNDDEPGNRGVWVYRGTDRRWSKRPTKQTASLEDFYTFVDANGTKDETLEKLMGDVERLFAPILRDVIAKRLAMSQPNAHDAFITFAATLICRNPTVVQTTAEVLVREARAMMAEVIATEESFQQFRNELRERARIDFPNIVATDRPRLLTEFWLNATKAGSLGVSILAVDVLCEKLARMAISFYHAAPSEAFITSDVPYAIKPLSDTDTFEIEQLVIPLSAKTAAVFDVEDEPVYRHRPASSRNVREVNAAILGTAREFLISCDPAVFSEEVLLRWAAADYSERTKIAGETLGA